MDNQLLTEIPSSLNQLARMVVRGFYNVEDALIIDMLIRHPCMKEDDICDALKFERKMLRARIATLKSDKFIQTKMKVETTADGKQQRANYYFINYKSFVNVVKYKLDHMQRKMDTRERDETSRSSFKCSNCDKAYTDLEADQIYDFTTGEFKCTFCGSQVEEDESGGPRHDSRHLVLRFNEQTAPLYTLLKDVENIKLAPELLDPEPTDLTGILGNTVRTASGKDGAGEWSGEATRHSGNVGGGVSVTFNAEDKSKETVTKERPIWMTESTITSGVAGASSTPVPNTESKPADLIANKMESSEDILSVLMKHEQTSSSNVGSTNKPPDSMPDESLLLGMPTPDLQTASMMEEGSSEEEEQPTLRVGDTVYALHDITEEIIVTMSTEEKDKYAQLMQEHYSHLYD